VQENKARVAYKCLNALYPASSCALDAPEIDSLASRTPITLVQLLKLQVMAEEPIRRFPYTPIEEDSVQLVQTHSLENHHLSCRL
jgi:hypothetical protein